MRSHYDSHLLSTTYTSPSDEPARAGQQHHNLINNMIMISVHLINKQFECVYISIYTSTHICVHIYIHTYTQSQSLSLVLSLSLSLVSVRDGVS